MKVLFKIYLLGQLIALPFMVGALAGALNSPDSPPAVQAIETGDSSTVHFATDTELCDALGETAINSVHAELQDLKKVTAELYGESVANDCIADLAP